MSLNYRKENNPYTITANGIKFQYTANNEDVPVISCKDILRGYLGDAFDEDKCDDYLIQLTSDSTGHTFTHVDAILMDGIEDSLDFTIYVKHTPIIKIKYAYKLESTKIAHELGRKRFVVVAYNAKQAKNIFPSGVIFGSEEYLKDKEKYDKEWDVLEGGVPSPFVCRLFEYDGPVNAGGVLPEDESNQFIELYSPERYF